MTEPNDLPDIPMQPPGIITTLLGYSVGHIVIATICFAVLVHLKCLPSLACLSIASGAGLGFLGQVLFTKKERAPHTRLGTFTVGALGIATAMAGLWIMATPYLLIAMFTITFLTGLYYLLSDMEAYFPIQGMGAYLLLESLLLWGIFSMIL